MNNIKKLLIDIDGVLFINDSIIDGARNTLTYLSENNYEFILVSNITRMPKQKIIQKLMKFDIFVDKDRLLTALSATVDYINSKKNNAKCFLIAPKNCEEEFKDTDIIITRKEEPVDFVVVGYDTRINFKMLNTAFRLIQDGAQFIGMQEDKIFPGYPKPSLALGAFVKCLEYSTDKKAIIIGKPNKNFFDLALKKISATNNETAMVGDSLVGDIIGAKNANLKTIMVKTGNYSEIQLHDSIIKPDYLIDSIKDLPRLFCL